MFFGSRQLHFELVALVKLLTEFTTLAAAGTIAAIWPADGFDGSDLTTVESPSTDDLMAAVSFGKSPLAEFTSEVASVWILCTWACKPLTPPLTERLVSPLTEFVRLLRAVQYAGLLEPQPLNTTNAIAAIVAIAGIDRLIVPQDRRSS
jgi:hypothetical protein